MKKISFILMAFALVMTLTQCKKNEEQPTANDNVVTITLNLNNNNGSKVNVNPAMGTVNFESGDKIYVGSGGKYVGFLTHNGTNFSGNITNPTEDQPLQLYFLGNVTPQETLSAGTTEECSVIISDQTEHLPVISCAASNENYVSGVTAYSAHLLNKCALVKFNVTTPSNSPICITGMHNKVTVDFANNTLTPSKDGVGLIKFPAGSGENVEKWAILLPQEEMENGTIGSVYSEDNEFTGTRDYLPAINNNDYLPFGIELIITTLVNPNEVPLGAINGLFTINYNGDQVYFSQGNLQYIGSASTPYWKFAENQWDYLGNNGQVGTSQAVDRDLFGWGTSGYHDVSDQYNVCFQPWSVSFAGGFNQSYNYWGYGPSTNMLSNNLTGSSANYDWGVYNSITNGGNVPNIWRTLTSMEWNYILTSRNTFSGIRFAKANVNGVNGIIILPDDWNATIYNLNETNIKVASYNSNVISLDSWNTIEENGAVFLPEAGVRNENSITTDYGFYWSSSHYDSYRADDLRFSGWDIYYGDATTRACGQSVRLVQDYNP